MDDVLSRSPAGARLGSARSVVRHADVWCTNLQRVPRECRTPERRDGAGGPRLPLQPVLHRRRVWTSQLAGSELSDCSSFRATRRSSSGSHATYTTPMRCPWRVSACGGKEKGPPVPEPGGASSVVV